METENKDKKKIFILVKNMIFDYDSMTTVEGVSFDEEEIRKLYETEKQEEIKGFQDRHNDQFYPDGEQKWEYTETKDKKNFFIYLSGYSVDDSCNLFIEEKYV